ncbi:ABC transporter ATP-binding protein/permease [Streptococcus pneumoniae]|nr:ABC transporter ATP-binding protein/permease [Streptococcus pneumoniae]
MKRQTVNQTLKRLVVDLANHPFLLFLAFLGTIAQVGLSIYLPILIGQVIDQVLVAGSSPVFWQIFLQMLLVVIGNTLVQWANPLLYNRLIFSYTRDLRERIIHKLHRLPIAFADRQGNGEMVSRVTTDIEQLAAGLTMIFNQFFIGVLMILVSILAMLQIHLLMTLLVLLLTPLSMVISRFIAKRSYHLFQKQTETRGIQTQLIEESLSQQTIIQSFNAQTEFIQRLREAHDNYSGYSQSAIFYSSTVNPSTRFVNALIYALLAGVGAYRIMMGSTLTIDLYQNGRSPLNLEQWRSWIAYVPQKVELFKGTIRSNLTLGFNQEVSDQKLWQALEIAQAKDFVSEKEGLLDVLVEAGGRNFSGGQKQRLSIARAVLRQAPFLILDDATSALDTITESKLLKAIRENFPNMSLILISQRTSTLQMADQILLLEKGELLAVGKHDDLMKSSQVYREINASQHGKED